jgi:hypothetical protein
MTTARNTNPSGRLDHRPDLIPLAGRLDRQTAEIAETVDQITRNPINEPDSWLLVPAIHLLKLQLEWLEEVISEIERHGLYYGLNGRQRPAMWLDNFDGVLYLADRKAA